MNTFKLSKRSLSRLEGVHPDLVRVVKRAIQLTKVDFGVTEGVRTQDRQFQLLKEGKTTTMNSKHIPDHTGYAKAVDLACYVRGSITWNEDYYRWLIQAMMTAAIMEGVQIEAGGLWRTFKDGPHFQLNADFYD